MAENNNLAWWQKMLGTEPQITESEKNFIAPGSNVTNYLNAQEKQDAMRLIEIGNRTGDPETKRIGQARLRVLEGRETQDDLDLLG